MRDNRPYGSEGGVGESRSLPLSILDSNAQHLERARINRGDGTNAEFCGDLESLPDCGFDLVVSAGGLSRLAANRGGLSRLAQKCAAGALIIAVEPTASLFRDLTLGLAGDKGEDLEMRLDAKGWALECARAGLAQIDARIIDTAADQAVLLTAEAPQAAEPTSGNSRIVLLRNGADCDGFATTLLDAIEERGAY